MVKAEAGDAAPAAEAPAAASGTGHLQLKIKSQDGDSIEFKVKPTTKFEKIFTVYCEKKGYDINAVRFLFDGEHLGIKQNVGDADLEDGDQIDCVNQQTGGR